MSKIHDSIVFNDEVSLKDVQFLATTYLKQAQLHQGQLEKFVNYNKFMDDYEFLEVGNLG